MLELPIRRDLALELDQGFRSAVHGAEGLETCSAHDDEQEHDGQECGKELRVHSERQPRDEPDEPRPHLAGASRSRLRRSARNSLGSKRTPRYCTRRMPSRSISDVRKVWSTSPRGFLLAKIPYFFSTARISAGVPVRNAQPAGLAPWAWA